MEVEKESEVETQIKKVRKRKKKLMSTICKQMEFYFSDANLRKDQYLQQLMKNLGDDFCTSFVPLNEFLKFNKIKSLTTDEKDIRRAIKSSQFLELNESGTEVRRKTPIDLNKDTNSCTIYVERLPTDADHRWIKSTFSRFGNVTYVSLPSFKTGGIKGFAFVEFESPESAVKACQFFGATIPQLCNEVEKVKAEEKVEEEVNEGAIEEVTPSVKRQRDSDSESDNIKKRIKVESEPMQLKIENCKKSKKTKRKNRRKAKNQTETKTVEKERPEVMNLRVMSKHEWLDFKKKYLKLQKSQMSLIKKSLATEDDERKKSNIQQKAQTSPSSSKNHFGNCGILKLTHKTPADEEFVESIFRKKIRDICGEQLAYIDVVKDFVDFNETNSEKVCYLRFNESEIVDSFLTNDELRKIGELSSLSKDETENYWNRIERCIQRKKETKERKKNRGFNKLVKKNEVKNGAEMSSKLNKHIKFE